MSACIMSCTCICALHVQCTCIHTCTCIHVCFSCNTRAKSSLPEMDGRRVEFEMEKGANIRVVKWFGLFHVCALYNRRNWNTCTCTCASLHTTCG